VVISIVGSMEGGHKVDHGSSLFRLQIVLTHLGPKLLNNLCIKDNSCHLSGYECNLESK
jgi:hypothetical protein